MNYVAGFLFRPARDCVVVVRKNKPEWQRNCLNGVGGKIEPGESPVEAMAREFQEETGASVPVERWTPYLEMRGPGWTVFFFYAAGGEDVKTTTAEEILHYWYNSASEWTTKVIPNLRWAIPMALDHKNNPEGPRYAVVEYGPYAEERTAA